MRRPVALALVLLAGCGTGGPALHPAGGSVRLRGGPPLGSGLVEFAAEDGGPAARGRLRPDGTFTLQTDGRPGAVAGRHRVVFLPMVLADGVPASHRHKAGAVHPRHARFETSGLTATVTAGADNRFALEVDPAP